MKKYFAVVAIIKKSNGRLSFSQNSLFFFFVVLGVLLFLIDKFLAKK